MRRALLMTLGISLALLGSPACRTDSRPAPAKRRDARASRDASPALAALQSAARDDFAALLGRRPAGARLWVALRAPAAWLEAMDALRPWLLPLPDLGPRVARFQRSLATWLGAWPPGAAAMRALGISPEGGLAFAWVSSSSPAKGFWVAALSGSPDKLLARVAGRPVATAHRLRLPWGSQLHCRAGATFVECASSALLLAGPRAGPARAGSPLAKPRGDAVFGYRGKGFVLRGALYRDARGPRFEARLEGPQVRELGEIFASPGSLPPPPSDALAALFFRLDPAGLSSALGWIPSSHATLLPKQGKPWSIASLVATSEGSWWIGLGPSGWRVGSPRRGGPDPFPQATEVSLGGAVRFFARTGPQDFVMGSSPAACASGTAGTAGPAGAAGTAGTTGPAGAAGAPAAWRSPASLALWLGLTDPLEWLPAGERARLLASLLGLGEAERAVVDGLRALLVALGEVWILARPSARGLELEVGVDSPFAEIGPAREDFRKAWQEKWRTAGGFSPEALSRLASAHPGTAMGRQAARLRGFSLGPELREPLVRVLLRGVSLLGWPEVPCARLASRLRACTEDFGRQVEPERWLTYDRLRLLGEAGDLGVELRTRARKGIAALTSRCDGHRGRLDRAASLGRCLDLPGCAPFVSCLVWTLDPTSEAGRQRPGSPR